MATEFYQAEAFMKTVEPMQLALDFLGSPKPARKAQQSVEELETFIDLFCGIGGFHYAARKFGLKCVFTCDIDAHAQKQYEANFGMRPAGDILELESRDIPDHDILFAGFPCQPFSIIGQMKGLEDARGTLIYEVVRILRDKRPKAFLLENVRQLATHSRGSTLKKILVALKATGYRTSWRILNALDYGLPQKRERIFMVGFIDNTLDFFEWPVPAQEKKALVDILEVHPDQRYYASSRIQASRKAKHTAKATPSIWHENKSDNISSHPFSCALRAGASHNYLLVNGERRLTPREMLRLQGFPESFRIVVSDSQLRKQTGNAVPVSMVKAVIGSMIEATEHRSLSL